MTWRIKPRLTFYNLLDERKEWGFYITPMIYVSYDNIISLDAIEELSIAFGWLFFCINLTFEKRW